MSRPAPLGLAAACLLSAWLAGCSCATAKEPAPSAGSLRTSAPGALKVLFVGNSLTYVNDLPRMVGALAEASGAAPLDAEVVTIGGANLDDLWADGRAPRALASGGFKFVVLQQGPTSQAEGRPQLVASAVRIAAEAARVGTRPAFYSVWPDEEYAARIHRPLPEAFAAAAESYAAASRAVNGLLLPAGAAWEAAWRKDPSLPLYGPDRFHPSPVGTLLAAIVVYQGLYGAPPSKKPERIPVGPTASLRVKDALWADLLAAAAEATRLVAR